MIEPTKPPAGATHLCELRPRAEGTGFEIMSRTRILSWRKDVASDYVLPVTAFGVVDKRAFVPSPTRPEDGFCFIECHAADGARQWVSPFKASLRLTDAHVRRLLHNEPTHALAPKGPTTISQATQPPRSVPPTLSEQRAMGMIKRHYATQAQQQQHARTSTQQLRREIAALKKRYE